MPSIDLRERLDELRRTLRIHQACVRTHSQKEWSQDVMESLRAVAEKLQELETEVLLVSAGLDGAVRHLEHDVVDGDGDISGGLNRLNKVRGAFSGWWKEEEDDRGK